jgi:hypothetical protein
VLEIVHSSLKKKAGLTRAAEHSVAASQALLLALFVWERLASHRMCASTTSARLRRPPAFDSFIPCGRLTKMAQGIWARKPCWQRLSAREPRMVGQASTLHSQMLESKLW